MEPVVPVPEPAGVDGNANADAAGGNEGGAAVPAPGGVDAVNGIGVPAAPIAAAPAPRAPPAPLNAVQYLNMLYHSGFMIPTGPGILLDAVSLFMGLFFSIVPSWAPYRLHR